MPLVLSGANAFMLWYVCSHGFGSRGTLSQVFLVSCRAPLPFPSLDLPDGGFANCDAHAVMSLGKCRQMHSTILRYDQYIVVVLAAARVLSLDGRPCATVWGVRSSARLQRRTADATLLRLWSLGHGHLACRKVY